MSERLKNLGRLEVKRIDAQQIKLKLETLRDAVRDSLDPFERLDALDGLRVSILAAEFAELLASYREALAEIESLKKVL